MRRVRRGCRRCGVCGEPRARRAAMRSFGPSTTSWPQGGSMRTTVAISSLLLFAAYAPGAAGQRPAARPRPAPRLIGQRAIVYTTAESTSFRLTPTDTLTFQAPAPTSEGQVYIFVDPRRTFQSMIGIGGAPTHARPRVFSPLLSRRSDAPTR